MRPRNFTTVSYTARVLDTTDRPVENVTFEIQYLLESTQQWVTFHKDRFQNGTFLFSELVNPPAPELPESIFLQDNHIPELRLVANPALYGSSKPEVLAFTCELKADPNAGTLLFDFGTSYLVEREVLPAGDVFSTFIVVTSRFSMVNQMNNIRLIQSLQAELRKKEEQINDLQNQVKVKDTTIAALNAQLLSALSQLEQKTLALTRLETINRELETTIGTLQAQIDLLQDQLDIDSRPVPVSTLYSQLVQEIDTSTQNNDSGYKLANISLKLKTLVTRDENGVNAQLFDLSTMDQINGAAVSEIVFDIAPNTTPASQAGTMPNVLGLTETAVRRILTSVGLRLNPVYQNNRQVNDGDSFKQTPAAGTDYNANDFVTVIFSKYE